MIRILILFAFCVLPVFMGHKAYSQIKLGVKVGTSVTNLKSKFDSGVTNKIGINAGVFSEIGISKKFFLRPEVLYAQKGWNLQLVPSGKSSMNLHYLSVPVLMGYHPLSKLSVLAGPEVGYLVGLTPKHKTSLNFYDLYQKVDVGLTIGSSYQLTSKIGIELRYIYGIKALSKVTYTDENGNPNKEDSDGYNRALQVGVFYKFGKSK